MSSRNIDARWFVLGIWVVATVALNFIGILLAGVTDPAGFDCSDPAIADRTVLTSIGRWVGASLGVLMPAGLLMVIVARLRNVWPSVIGVALLVPVVVAWVTLVGARIPC